MRELIGEAEQAMSALKSLSGTELDEGDFDSPRQGESLQRIQQEAGTISQAMNQISNLARHARSYQAQAHQRNSGNKPM